jgi:hypothetical protein
MKPTVQLHELEALKADVARGQTDLAEDRVSTDSQNVAHEKT